MCVILQFASTIILRIYHPRVERGYKVPIESNFWYATILFPTFAIQIFYVSYVIISQFSSVTKNTVENDIFTILKSILVVAPVCFFIIQLILEVIKGDYGRDEYLEDAIIVSSTQQHSLLDTDKLDLADEPLLETDVDGKDNLSSRISFGGI